VLAELAELPTGGWACWLSRRAVGLHEQDADAQPYLHVAQLCIRAGADMAMMARWIEEGRRRASRSGPGTGVCGLGVPFLSPGGAASCGRAAAELARPSRGERRRADGALDVRCQHWSGWAAVDAQPCRLRRGDAIHRVAALAGWQIFPHNGACPDLFHEHSHPFALSGPDRAVEASAGGHGEPV